MQKAAINVACMFYLTWQHGKLSDYQTVKVKMANNSASR